MYLLIVGAMLVFTACNWGFPGGNDAECTAVDAEAKVNDNFPRCQVERGQCLTDHSCCMDARGYPTEATEATEAPAAGDGYDGYDDYDAYDDYEDAYEDAMDDYEDAYEDAMDEYEDLMNDYY